MELNRIEERFFSDILNATLDEPVQAVLKCEGEKFEVLVVPHLTENGDFFLKYFGTPEGKVKGEITFREAFGSPPILEKAWISQEPVSVKLSTRSIPLSMNYGRTEPEIPATIYYADVGFTGTLKVDKNQIVLRDTPLKTAELCIPGFPDFTIKPLRTMVGLSSVKSNPDYQEFIKEIEGFGLTINPQTPKITLDSEDGWRITIVKESAPNRNSISHYVWMTRDNDEEYGVDAVTHFLNVFNQFLALCSGAFHFPSAVIGSDKKNSPVWGQIGPFKATRPSRDNWFDHRKAPQQSTDLQELFPKFWQRFNKSPDEITAIIDCYVGSREMRDSGLVKDAVAKSFMGLGVLAEQILTKANQTANKSAGKNIQNALACYPEIPYQILDSTQFPMSTQLAQDIAIGGKPPSRVRGPHLLNDVRNYVSHPLEEGTPMIKEPFKNYLDSDYSHYLFLHDLSQFYLEYSFLRYCNFKIDEQDYRKPIEVEHFRQ